MNYDVVIAGAGPVGLLLACELKLAGVSVLLLERMADPNLPIKAALGARALNIPSVEAFYRRGLLLAVRDAAIWWIDASEALQKPALQGDAATPNVGSPDVPVKMPPKFAGHFAGIMLNGDLIDYSDPEFSGRGPASAGGVITLQSLEALLAERANQLHVEIRRGTALIGFEPDREGVTAFTSDTATIRTGWLVGCDGGRSTVRKLAGFEFPGTEPEITGYSAMVEIANPEKLSPGWNRTAHGAYVNGPLPGRILTVEFDGPPANREAPISLDLLQATLRRLSDTDVTLTAVHAVTRWTDNARQASTYRLGRVLLAGDAAHVHSPFGGQGLNVGIGDAMNLGWKLAATVKGWASETLLDTYTTERHPIGAWALEWTRAQVALMRPKRHERALTSVVEDLVGTREGATYFAKKISGVWQRYNMPGDHPLIGRSAPDLEFKDGTRLGEYLIDGSALLFDFAGDNRIRDLGAKFTGKLKLLSTQPKEASSLTALFVRPDGCVAWAATGEPSLHGAVTALSEWLGPIQ